jgi:hypothetical protein
MGSGLGLDVVLNEAMRGGEEREEREEEERRG